MLAAAPVMDNQRAFASGPSILHVNSQDQNGNNLPGFYTLLSANGTVLQTGYTPVDFTLINGAQYILRISDYANYEFNYWLDNGSTNSTRLISITSYRVLNAVYWNINGPPPSGYAYVQVTSVYVNGTAKNGMYTGLYQGGTMIKSGYTPYTFWGMIGVAYTVGVSDYGGWYFAHWNDATSQRYHPVTPQAGIAISLQAIYTPGLEINPQAPIFEPGYSRNTPIAVTNHLSYSVSLTGINGLSTTSPYVTAQLSSTLPISIAPGGIARFNLRISVSSSVPYSQYNITGTAVFSPSASVPFTEPIKVVARFMNGVSVMKQNGNFQSTISALNQTKVSQAVGYDSNYTLTAASVAGQSVTNVTGYWNNGQYSAIKTTPTLLLNLTTTSSRYMILNQSWVSTATSGTNYTLTLQQNYSQYNVSVSAEFGSCKCVKVDLQWVTSVLNDLHLGDTINITNVATLREFFQGLYYAVNTLSTYYSASGNSTLQTLGSRYAQVLPAINYTMNNLPTNLSNLAVTSGVGTITDADYWSCLFCTIGISFFILLIVGQFAGAVCAAAWASGGLFIWACLFVILVIYEGLKQNTNILYYLARMVCSQWPYYAC